MINTEDYAEDFIQETKDAALANGRTDPYIVKYTDENGDAATINTENDYTVGDEDYDGAKDTLQLQAESLVKHLASQLIDVTTTPYNASAENQVLLVNPSAPITINLPTASAASGKTIVVKKANNSAHAITVSGTIDGGSGYTVTDSYGIQSFLSNGTDWFTVDSGGAAAASSNVVVSANDTTPGNLEAKIVAGSGITLATLNDGFNEQLEITSSGADLDESVKVSANDTTAGYLNGKLVAGSNISLVEGSDGGDEILTVAFSGTPAGFDTTAIHDNVSGEVSAVTVKGTPTGSDLLLIEDAAAANVKKSITIGSIDHDALTNFVTNEHIDWTAASAGTIDPTNYVAPRQLISIDVPSADRTTTSPSYDVPDWRILYPGTNNAAKIKEVWADVDTSGGAGDGITIELWDVTNSTDHSLLEEINTDGLVEITDGGLYGTLPTGPALFTLRFLSADGSTTVGINTVTFVLED